MVISERAKVSVEIERAKVSVEIERARTWQSVVMVEGKI